jgi:hypothetical protein
MLANAWYPHTYFKLSFGAQDKIAQKLDSLTLEVSEPILRFTDTDKKLLRKTIASQNLNSVISCLRKYVPFRLIIPFLEPPNIVQMYYSTVTDLAKFLGWSTSKPRRAAM